jgi:hypothetical protein
LLCESLPQRRLWDNVDVDMAVLRVRDGEVADGGSWVYAWLKADQSPQPVVFVGGTGLPPVVRFWLHLHDPDPDIGRMAAGYAELARQPLDVLAFAVPPELARPAVRDAVIARLLDRGLLAEDYVGFPPGTDPAGREVDEVVDRVVAGILEYLGRP